jgi:hypothetical protein
MELTELCTKLKFEHLPVQLDSLWEQAAKRELNYPEFLNQALIPSGRHRLKGVERGLRLARFPYVKTLEQFDFSFQPAIDRKLIRVLVGLAFVERVENLILLGPPGTGKTMLAVAFGIKAIEAGHRVLFLTLETLITRLRGAQAENRLGMATRTMDYAQGPSGRRVNTLAATVAKSGLASPGRLASPDSPNFSLLYPWPASRRASATRDAASGLDAFSLKFEAKLGRVLSVLCSRGRKC